jgi:DNA-binding response OmpR family regulator
MMCGKVLVVDDQPDIRRLVRVTLGKRFETIEADNGVKALAIARLEHPAVVVLDVMMPGEMDGFQVLDAIRNDPDLKDVRVIMLTARGQETDCAMGLARGADGYFIKPFSPLLLAKAIRELVA